MNKKAMTIIYVTMQWPGASETFCARDVLALQSLGHIVRVVALRPAPKNADVLLASQKTKEIRAASLTASRYVQGMVGIIKHPSVFLKFILWVLKNEKSFSRKLSFLILTPCFFWASDEIIKDRSDIVHLFWGHYPSGVAQILKWRMGNNCPPITMFLGAYDLNMDLSLSAKVAKESNAVFTHANANTDRMMKIGLAKSEINVVHRGIDITGMEELSLSSPVPARDWSHMVFVGRLIKDKGAGHAVTAMQEIVKHYPDASLEIIGDGPERGDLQTLTRDLGLNRHVNFRGYLPPSDVYRSLYRSGIFIFPSTSGGERLPNAVKEAMYAGVIPVVSKTPGIEELVSHAHDGFILDEITPDCIAQTVLDVLKVQNREQVSKNAQKKIADGFDVRVSMSRYAAVWEKLLSKSYI